MEALRVIIADDHPVVLAGACAVLRKAARSMEVIGTADSGRALLALLENQACDVLVTDFSMPSPGDARNDGMALLRLLRRRHPGLPIVVMTMLDNQAILRAALALGVTGLVEKASALDELVVAVEAAAVGSRYVGQGLRERLDQEDTQAPSRLSPHEIEVVRLYVNGMKVKEVAAHLNRSIKTVSRQKGDAMRKLGLSNHSELYTYARSCGLLI